MNDSMNQIKTFELYLNAKHKSVLVQHIVVQFRTSSCGRIIYSINIFYSTSSAHLWTRLAFSPRTTVSSP